MTVLRRAHVEVEPDVTNFDAKLREKFNRIDPGGKAGKQLGGQLNRALKRLDLDPVDIKADPRQALEAIDATERQLRALSRQASTVEIKVQAERGLAEIAQFRRQIGKLGPEEGQGFGARFVGRLGPVLASAPISPAILAAALPAIPVLSAALAAGVIGGAAGVGIVGGVVLAARDPRVKEAGARMGEELLSDLTARSSNFVDPTLAGIARLRAGFREMGPDLDRIFDSSRFVEPLVDGGLVGARRFVKGVADAVDEADPVIEALRNMISQVGITTGETLSLLASDAEEGASAVNDLTLAISNLITVTGQLVHGAAQVKGYTDELDKWLDKSRYVIEDLDDVGIKADLTADGFKRGSKEALAYREATLGTATAADFARLKMAGMTDAEIAAADASGTYRAQLDKVKAATEEAVVAADALLATQAQVTEAQRAATQAQDLYKRSLDSMAPAQGRAAQLANGLRTAQEALYGSAIAGAEANETYQASWDELSGSVKANKATLDVNTAAGRANRDALQALLRANNDMYFANIEQGISTDTATRKHRDRTAAIREEASKLGLNKRETDKLIATYGKIPGEKETNLVLSGLTTIAEKLENLYIAQRALAEGKTVDQIRGGIRGVKAFKLAGGGQVHGPGGSTGDKVPALLSDREFVLRAAAVDKLGVRQVEYMNRYGELPAFAKGGLVADVDTSKRWPYPVNLRDTFVMSMSQALSKVAPQFGGWPSSPAAQRGDSGVWRKVLQLIKSGPDQGSFGNAYRPGDPLWHGSGRAVDWMGYNMDALASFLAARRPLELIHRTSRRDYAYTRGRNAGSFDEGTMNAHRNHIHVAMDDGGLRMLQPGLNVIPNNTGRPEPIAGPAAMAAMGGVTVNLVNPVIASERQAVELVTKAYNTAVKERKIRPVKL